MCGEISIGHVEDLVLRPYSEQSRSACAGACTESPLGRGSGNYVIAWAYRRHEVVLDEMSYEDTRAPVCLSSDCHDCRRDGRGRNMEGLRISKQLATGEATSPLERSHVFPVRLVRCVVVQSWARRD